MEFYRVTLQSQNEGSRSFAFKAKDFEEAIQIGSEFAKDMNVAPGHEWYSHDVMPFDLDGHMMELCTF